MPHQLAIGPASAQANASPTRSAALRVASGPVPDAGSALAPLGRAGRDPSPNCPPSKPSSAREAAGARPACDVGDGDSADAVTVGVIVRVAVAPGGLVVVADTLGVAWTVPVAVDEGITVGEVAVVVSVALGVAVEDDVAVGTGVSVGTNVAV